MAGPLVMDLAAAKRRPAPAGRQRAHPPSSRRIAGQPARRGRARRADRQRRAVPRQDARPSWRTSRAEQALQHPTWQMGPKITDRLGHADEQGAGGDRGPLAVRPAARADRGDHPPASRSSTRSSSSSTARCWPSCRRRTCGCRSSTP